MRKSNVLIALIAVVVSVFLLWLWFYLSFDKVDNPTDLALSVVWWVVVALAVVLIVRFEAARQQRVRTVYVAREALFNSERGLVQRTDQPVVDAVRDVLSGLKYDFTKADLPSRDKVSFEYLVRTKKFDLNSSQNGNGKEPEWEGEVVTVATGDTQEFKTKAELEAILAAA